MILDIYVESVFLEEFTPLASHSAVCAVLCCAVLCCAVLCCAVLCCAVLCVVLCNVLCLLCAAKGEEARRRSGGKQEKQEPHLGCGEKTKTKPNSKLESNSQKHISTGVNNRVKNRGEKQG